MKIKERTIGISDKKCAILYKNILIYE